MSVRPKRAAEQILTLKGVGATAAEANSAVQQLQAIANDPETASNDIQTKAARIALELQSPTGPASIAGERREALMAQALTLAAKVT